MRNSHQPRMKFMGITYGLKLKNRKLHKKPGTDEN